MLDFILGRPKKRMWGGDGEWSPVGSGFGDLGASRARTQAGVYVDEDLAKTYAACWCATRIICETVCGLPLFLYKRNKDDGREHGVDLNIYDMLKNMPNPDMGSMVFREGRTEHQVNWGNGFAEIERDELDPRRPPIALWPIHASRVRPTRRGEVSADGRDLTRHRYMVRNDDGTWYPMMAEDMLHIPGCLSEDGIWGKSVVAYGRQTIGMGLSIQRHSATTFGSGNIPRIVVTGMKLKDSEARKNFRREWKEIHGNPDSAEIAILSGEEKVEKLSFSNEDSQFLGAASLGVHEIARLYRIPPHKLSELMGSKYATIEQMSLEFVVDSIVPWCLRWEEQIQLKLLTASQRKKYFVEHQLAGLLRGALKERYDAYEVGLRSGWLTVNIVKRLENLPTIGPAGDQHLVMTNMTTLERVFQGLPPPSAMGKADGLTVNVGGAGKSAAGGQAPQEAAPDLLPLPDVRQQQAYDCGPASTMSVAEHFEVGGGRKEEDYVAELGTTDANGTSTEAIIDWFNRAGLAVTSGQGMTVDDLATFHKAGKPVIVPVQMYGETEAYDAEEAANETGHFVVVNGVGMGQVMYQDPLAGQQIMAQAEFEKRWHDRETDGTIIDHFGIAVGQAFGDDPDEQSEEAKSESSADETLGGSTAGPGAGMSVIQPPAKLEAARAVLVDALRRMYAREGNAAKRAAKGDFDAWLLEWMVKQRGTLTEALRPAFSVLLGAGVVVKDTLPEYIAWESADALRDAYNTDTPVQFNERLERWSERAEAMADRIMDNLKDEAAHV